MSGNLAIWWNILNGSTVKFWVEDGGSDIFASATIGPANLVPRQVGHDQLVPGPAEEPVENNQSLEAEIEVAFQGSDTQPATIHAQVIDPNGQVFPDSDGEMLYAYNVEGKSGENPARANLQFVSKAG